jgi:hypothetical protein
MPPTQIEGAAFDEIKKLAEWVRQSAKMEPEKGRKDLLVCVEKAREERVRPLLKELGYAYNPVKLLSQVESVPISKWNLGSSRFAAAKMWKDSV